MIENKKEKVLFSKEAIQKRVKEMGLELAEFYKEKNLVVISLLKGSFVFTADLTREIYIPLEVEFMTTESYGNNEFSSGDVKIIQDIRGDIEGKDILIVDDIMDTGHTMAKVIEHLGKKQARSIRTCVMLDKPSRRQVDIVPDYIGYKIPDVFIVGYGLNYGKYYRNTPYIFTFE